MSNDQVWRLKVNTIYHLYNWLIVCKFWISAGKSNIPMIPLCKSFFYIRTWECPATPLPWTFGMTPLFWTTEGGGWVGSRVGTDPFFTEEMQTTAKKKWQFPSIIISLTSKHSLDFWMMNAFQIFNCSHSSEFFHMLSVSACNYPVFMPSVQRRLPHGHFKNRKISPSVWVRKRLSWSHKPSTSMDAWVKLLYFKGNKTTKTPQFWCYCIIKWFLWILLS